MRKILSLVVTLLLVASFILPAFADGWYCPSCGRYNDSNFCPKDGTKKPADLDKSRSNGSTASQNGSGVEPAKSVKFQSNYDEETDKYYAIITGYDKRNHPMWSYRSGKYPGAQVPGVEEIGLFEDRYYFVEDGTIIVLDAGTGCMLWENSDFAGGIPISFLDEDGTLYLSGYLGPVFFAVDYDGNTIHRIESFGMGFGWTNSIKKSGNKIVVSLGTGPLELAEKYYSKDGFVFHVDLNDFTYALQSPR